MGKPFAAFGDLMVVGTGVCTKKGDGQLDNGTPWFNAVVAVGDQLVKLSINEAAHTGLKVGGIYSFIGELRVEGAGDKAGQWKVRKLRGLTEQQGEDFLPVPGAVATEGGSAAAAASGSTRRAGGVFSRAA